MQPSSRERISVPLEPIFVLVEGVWEVAGLCGSLLLNVVGTAPSPAGEAALEVPFRADSGAAVTRMSLVQAEQLGLPIPSETVTRQYLTATGPITQIVREGRIRAFVPGWARQGPYDWPCVFIEDQPEMVPPLLGLYGVIQDLRLTFDGTSTPGAFFGNLIVDALR